MLGERDAADFLLEKTAGKRRPTAADPQDAQALAHDLGGLALALEQAGAFIAKHRGSFAEYRQRWQRHDTKVLEWFDQRAMKYPKSVATTWQTSVDKLSADGRNLLKVLCWLAPDPIPADMVRKLTPPEGSRPPLLRRLLDRLTLRKRPAEIDVEKALADLATYSLVKWDGAAQSVTVHRLVEEITRYRLADKERVSRLEQCLWMVEDFTAGDAQDVRTWPGVYAPARTHIEAVTREADRLGVPHPTMGLMSKLGIYLLTRGSFAEAEPLMRRAVAVAEAADGPDQPLVAFHLNTLAVLLRNTNRLAEAEPLFRRALAIHEASSGPDSPEGAVPLSNLAELLRHTNRPAEAEPLYLRALAIGEATLGPAHHAVAIRLGSLAQLYHDTSRFAEAEPLMRRALAIAEAAFGPDHPNVAGQLSNLAALLQVTGRSAEAEPMYRRSLAIDEASFGPDHPSVATQINNLAHLLQHTNRLADAEPLFRRAFAINEASYGRDHPKVANNLNNLARFLEITGRSAEAEPLYRRAVAILRQSLGEDHPDTKLVRRNYAIFLQTHGRSRDSSTQQEDLP